MNARSSLLTCAEAAQILAISSTKLSRLAIEGKIPHVKLPTGDLRFDEQDLLEWVDALKISVT